MLRIKKHSEAFTLDKPRREVRGHNRQIDDKHRIWIKSLPSIISNSPIDVDPHHVKKADHSVGKPSDSGGKRVDDKYLIPLSRSLHDELHDIGEKNFEKKYGVDLVKLALGFWAESGNDDAARISINWTVLRAKEVERQNVG